MPMLYKSPVRPHLEYGNIIWGPFNKEDAINVEKVQRRATKIVESTRSLDYGDRMKKLNIPSLQHRRRRGDMIFAYKVFTGKVDVNPNEFLHCHQRERGVINTTYPGKRRQNVAEGMSFLIESSKIGTICQNKL